jgi:LPXTG-motif cell wall-anchored protein
MEFMLWLLLAGAAVGVAGVWYSWKRRRKSNTEK